MALCSWCSFNTTGKVLLNEASLLRTLSLPLRVARLPHLRVQSPPPTDLGVPEQEKGSIMDTPIVFAPPRVYDATAVLGFGTPSPEAKPGEILLRYGGWSLRDLRDKCDLMHRQDWYARCPWASDKLPSGLYALRLPVPNSNRKTFNEQKALLLPGEEPAPVVLAASAMLSHLISTGERLLAGQWLRCKEQTADGYRVALGWHDGRLNVNRYWYDYPDGFVWLASARRLPEPCPSSP